MTSYQADKAWCTVCHDRRLDCTSPRHMGTSIRRRCTRPSHTDGSTISSAAGRRCRAGSTNRRGRVSATPIAVDSTCRHRAHHKLNQSPSRHVNQQTQRQQCTDRATSDNEGGGGHELGTTTRLRARVRDGGTSCGVDCATAIRGSVTDNVCDSGAHDGDEEQCGNCGMCDGSTCGCVPASG